MQKKLPLPFAAGFSVVAFGLVYALMARIGLEYSLVASNVTLIWPPTGIAVFVLVRWGYRFWPGIVIGDLLANFDTGVPLWTIVGICLGNLFQAAGAVWLLKSRFGFQPDLRRTRDVLALLAAAVGCAAVSALIGPAFLVAAGTVPLANFGYTWLIWCMGDSAGVVVVAPALLAWEFAKKPFDTAPRPGLTEAVGLAASLAGVCLLVFGGLPWLGQGYQPASLLLFPVTLWAALRFGVRGAAYASLLIAAAAVAGTVHGNGPFADAVPLVSTLRWWVFANTIAITGLLIASSQSERHRATEALAQAHGELERRVSLRTHELAASNAALRAEMAERQRLEGEIIAVSEREQMRIGRELHDGVGQVLTGVAMLSEALRKRLAALSPREADQARRIESLTSEAVSQTRSLARGLYPVELEAHGLMSALEQLAVQTRRHSGLRCIFRCDRPVLLEGPDVAVHLYRIAQEAINNALRHSRARNLLIELGSVPGTVRLRVTDDGVGMPYAKKAQDGMGLRTMKYRAHLIGGRLSLETPAQHKTGLSLIVEVPVVSRTQTEEATADAGY